MFFCFSCLILFSQMRKQLYTRQQTKHQYSNLLSTIYHYYYFKFLQPLKTIDTQKWKLYTWWCVLYIKTRKTDEKKKTQTDKDVKKTKCLLIQKKNRTEDWCLRMTDEKGSENKYLCRVRKNFDYMKNLKFSSRVEISSQVS